MAIHISDGTQASVLALHDDASCVDGDIITLPGTYASPQSFPWADQLTISKAIHLRGGGSGRVIARSLTSNVIGTGAKTFAVSIDPKVVASVGAISAGQTLRVIHTGTKSEWMEGTVTTLPVEVYSDETPVNSSYPVDFKYGAGTAYVTGGTLGTPSNHYDGFIGMKFTVDATPLTVSHLGRRFVTGNTQTHIVKLVNANGSAISGASVSINMVGGVNGEFKYGALAEPVVLAASTTYYLVSEEFYGVDLWYGKSTSVTTTVAAALAGSVTTEQSMGMSITSTGGTGTHAFWHLATMPATTIVHNRVDSGNTYTSYPLILNESTVASIEVSGIKFSYTGGTSYFLFNFGAGVNGKPTLLHDCWFDGATNGVNKRWNSNRGIIWNCSEDQSYPDTGVAHIGLELQLESNAWAEAFLVSAPTMGDLDTTGIGNFYMEDCDFHAGNAIIDFSNYCRGVVRNCLINNAVIGSHGADTGFGNSSMEVYDNVAFFNNNEAEALAMNYWFNIRGSTGVVTGNVFPDITTQTWGNKAEIDLQIQQLRRNAGNYPCWGASSKTIAGNTQANPTIVTTSAVHGYSATGLQQTVTQVRISGSNSTPTLDGLRTITILSPTTFSVPVDVTVAGTAGTVRAIEYPAPYQLGYSHTGSAPVTTPFYFWNNSRTLEVWGSDYPDPPAQDACTQGVDRDTWSDYIQEGRDWIQGTAKPGYTKFTYPHPLRTDEEPEEPAAPVSHQGNQMRNKWQLLFEWSRLVGGNPKPSNNELKLLCQIYLATTP